MFITEQLQSRDSELRKNLEKDEPLPSITCNDFVWHVLTCEIHVISDDISVCLNVVLIFRQIRLQNVNAGHWTRRVHDQLGSLRRCVLSRFVGMSMHVYRCIMFIVFLSLHYVTLLCELWLRSPNHKWEKKTDLLLGRLTAVRRPWSIQVFRPQVEFLDGTLTFFLVSCWRSQSALGGPWGSWPDIESRGPVETPSCWACAGNICINIY